MYKKPKCTLTIRYWPAPLFKVQAEVFKLKHCLVLQNGVAAINLCLVFMSSQLVKSGFTHSQGNPSEESMQFSMTFLLQRLPPATFPANLTAARPWTAQLSSKDIISQKEKKNTSDIDGGTVSFWNSEWWAIERREYKMKGREDIKGWNTGEADGCWRRDVWQSGRHFIEGREVGEKKESAYVKVTLDRGKPGGDDGASFIYPLTLPSSFGLSLKWTTGPGWVLVDLGERGKDKMGERNRSSFPMNQENCTHSITVVSLDSKYVQLTC